MSAQLLIRDGSPNWWLSPDVWTVPGNDPNGVPGTPVAGKPAYVWAHIANLGSGPASGTRVDFYWANPAAQIVVGAATLVGSAYADLAPKDSPGDAQDVLCLVPWKPAFVNDGHECLLAVAHHPADSAALPDPLPNGFDLNPPAYDPIAQRNLNILMAGSGVPHAITINALPREDKSVMVSIEMGGTLDEKVLAQLRLKGFRPARKTVVRAGLSLQAICGDQGLIESRLELRISRGTQIGVYLSVQAAGLKEREYQLVHVIERSKDRVLGGISYAVITHYAGGKQ